MSNLSQSVLRFFHSHVKRRCAFCAKGAIRAALRHHNAIAKGVAAVFGNNKNRRGRTSNRAFFAQLSCAICLCSFASGCGPQLETGDDARIRVTPARQIAFSRVTIGQERSLPFVITSVGRDKLEIDKITWEGSQAIQIALAGDLPHTMPNASSFPVSVEFSPTETQPAPTGKIRIYSNDPDTPVYTLDVVAQQLAPQINVVPSAEERLIIGQTDVGHTTTRPVVVTNVGDLPLTISDIKLVAGKAFSYALPKDRSLPIALPANARASLDIQVAFTPQAAGKLEGSLVFVSDDPIHPEYKLPIIANSDTPCLRISPSLVEFKPSVSVGTTAQKTVKLESCSDVPLTISEVKQTSGSSVFSSKLTGNGAPLEKDSSATLTIEYSPKNIGTDQAKFVVISNDPLQPNAKISVVANASNNQCPKAVARGRIKGSSVYSQTIDAAPLDTIEFDGSQSSDPEGTKLKYHWSIENAPTDSVASIASIEDSPNASFFVDLAGDYSICLNVEDGEAMMSCNKDCVTIHAVPRETIHVQLVWNVPGVTPTKVAGSGADLDLHFLSLPDGHWNDTGEETLKNGTDVFWKNKNPTWKVGSQTESPSLDIDSLTGSEPENINLDKPNPCRWYAIGVNYYENDIYGAAYATVRIYISGKLRFEKPKIKLTRISEFRQVTWLFWDGDKANIFESDFATTSDDAWHNITPVVPSDVIEDARKSSPQCFDQ